MAAWIKSDFENHFDSRRNYCQLKDVFTKPQTNGMKKEASGIEMFQSLINCAICRRKKISKHDLAKPRLAIYTLSMQPKATDLHQTTVNNVRFL